jgi:hypothetical protein
LRRRRLVLVIIALLGAIVLVGLGSIVLVVAVIDLQPWVEWYVSGTLDRRFTAASRPATGQ